MKKTAPKKDRRVFGPDSSGPAGKKAAAAGERPVGESPKGETSENAQPSRERSETGKNVAELFKRGIHCHNRENYDEAVNFYTRALLLDPYNASIYLNLGAAFRSQDKYRAAIACYMRALSIAPENSGIYNNLGNVYRNLGKLDEAVACFMKALGLKPGFSDALYNLGLVLHDLGRLKEAIKFYNRTIQLKPDHRTAFWDRALAYLLGGEIGRGFIEYEWRWKRKDSPPRQLGAPLWIGENLGDRTLLVHAEQGFGDTIQFVRYLPLIKNRGGRIFFECQPELVSLVEGMKAVDQVIPRGEKLPAFDLHVPLLTLPKVFGTGASNVPNKVPYFFAPPEAGFPVKKPEGTKMSIGITWAGKPTHKNDHNRSAPFEHFLCFAGLPGVTLYSLQKGDRAQDRLKHAHGILVRDLGGGLRDFGDTAKIITQLDLVITVDTSVAHLCGAMGAPVWTLLPFSPDWRWMLDVNTSPWYPSMRLFRQKSYGNWEGVTEEALNALKKELRRYAT